MIKKEVHAWMVYLNLVSEAYSDLPNLKEEVSVGCLDLTIVRRHQEKGRRSVRF